MQRERNAEAVAAQHRKSMAALEDAGSDHAEEEEGHMGRNINRTLRKYTREPTETSQESETRVNSRVSAGVAQARREAKKRRDKPYNDIKKLIQEARQLNRKSKATAARMLTRIIESNKTIRQMQQTHHPCRARARRQRKTQLANRGATEAIAYYQKMESESEQRPAPESGSSSQKVPLSPSSN